MYLVAEWTAEALEEYDIEAWSNPPVDQATASDAIMAGAPLLHRRTAPRKHCRAFAVRWMSPPHERPAECIRGELQSRGAQSLALPIC